MFDGDCTENLPVVCSEHLQEQLYAALNYYGMLYFKFFKSVRIFHAMSPSAVPPSSTLKISQACHSLYG